MAWVNLEHKVWKYFKLNEIKNRNLILAVSGGMDSMVLLGLIHRLQIKVNVTVAHFHHGPTENLELQKHRDENVKLIERVCQKLGPQIKLRLKKETQVLRTEAQFRQARLKFFFELMAEDPQSLLVTAHHQDDLLEGYFLKLMRGSGPASFRHFVVIRNRVFRPFLETKKIELSEYAKQMKISWSDDPSNQQTTYLRNWIRNKLFPSLSTKKPGALQNIFYSLSLLIHAHAKPRMTILQQSKKTNKKSILALNDNLNSIAKSPLKVVLDRAIFKGLDERQREAAIFKAISGMRSYFWRTQNANSGKKLNQKSFDFFDIRKGRVKEICKRLDKNQKVIIFSIGPLKCLTNAVEIVLEFRNQES